MQKSDPKGQREKNVPDLSIYDYLVENIQKNGDNLIAYNYFGKITNFREFLAKIDQASSAFRCYGIRPGDVVTICLPNTPEGLIALYALNKIGAIANMIHPLSGENEIKHYINETKSVMVVAADFCYEKINNIIGDTDVYKVIIVSPANSMPAPMSIGYFFMKKGKEKKVPKSEEYIAWNDFVARADKCMMEFKVNANQDVPAIYLHSGGTTGTPKCIVLTNGNFNALGEQAKIGFADVKQGDKAVALMPIFHGFGLGVTMHCCLIKGCELILMPQFNLKQFTNIMRFNKPHVIMGVPTLFEAMVNSKDFKTIDLSNLKHVISGGDSLSRTRIDKIDEFLESRGAKIRLSQGYGMTECLAATCWAYGESNKKCSIGIPFPSNYYKICEVGSQDVVKPDEVGEIVISGPTVMTEYLNNPDETNLVLQKHKDGRIWLHTGDLGSMDSDGVITYHQRLKRMIISSGYNVYPQQIEQVISEHEAVLKCSVIGIPHPYKMQVAKACIVLKEGYKKTGSIKKEIKELCELNLSKFSNPYVYEFRESLPTTLIGKIDYKKLEAEALEGMKKNEENS